MAKKLLQGLAITFGGGLALGAGFKLGQAAARPRQTGSSELSSLASRLDLFEERIQSVENRPPWSGSGAPPDEHSTAQFLDRTLGALESRLAERIALMGDQLQQVEARFNAELEGAAGRQTEQVNTLSRRLDEIQTRLRSEIEAGDRRNQEQVAAVAQELQRIESHLPASIDAALGVRMAELNRKLEADLEQAQSRTLEALVQTIETKVVQRISDLESNLVGQSEAIGGLRDKSLRTDQNMQKLLLAVEKLCDQTERQISRAAPEPKPAEISAAPLPAESPPAAEPAPPAPGPPPAPEAVAVAAGGPIEPSVEPRRESLAPQTEPAPAEARAESNGTTPIAVEAETVPDSELGASALDLLAPDPKPKKRWRIPLAFSMLTVAGGLTGLELLGVLNSHAHSDPSSMSTVLAQIPPQPSPEHSGPAAASGDENALIQLARAQAARKDWAQAEQNYRSALRLNERNRDAILGLSDALYQQQKFAESAAVLGKLSSLR